MAKWAPPRRLTLMAWASRSCMQSAVGQAGQRIVMGQVTDMCLGPLSLGDVGKGADRAVLDQPTGAHLERRAVRSGALVNGVGELEAARFCQLAHGLVAVKLAIAKLPLQQVVEARAGGDETRLEGRAVRWRGD